MIESQQLENYPEFGDNSSKVMPDPAKYSAGFVQSDVLPAEWVNWAWSKNTKGITALNKGVKSIEDELNALVREVGITPEETDNTQVKTSVNLLIQKSTGNLPDLATTSKDSLVAAINEHVRSTGNPHSVTKSQVGLGNVANYPQDTTPTAGSPNYITSGAVQQHVAATSAHGSTPEATASSIVARDAEGRAQIADPADPADIANKNT